MKAKETLETLQTYPITYIIFLPGLYVQHRKIYRASNFQNYVSVRQLGNQWTKK